MRKYLSLFILLTCLYVSTRGQTIDYPDLSGLPQPTQAKGLRYWFDNDVSQIQTVDGVSGLFSIDVSSIQDGIHTLHYQVVDNNDQVASIRSAVFLKPTSSIGMPSATTASSLRYWFDNSPDVQVSSNLNGIRMVDVSMLDDGLHTIHYQIVDSQGELCTPLSSTFLKFGFTIDVQTVPTQAQSVRYWFDGDESTMKVTDIANASQIIDLSEMEPGIHTLYYQLIDVYGDVSSPVASVFLKNFDKPEEEANRIVKYDYWMNDDQGESLHTVTLDNASNPLQLIGLFAMPQEQIRSCYFHLEMEEGIPVLYAKNDFHILCHDARGYMVHDSKSFIDYSIRQEVSDMTLLEPGVRATTEKPAENTIKWYCLVAERGDSLEFKLDRTATIQLFAPSGEEVYSVSGANSVKFGGVHATETGTYYLALHDVTATQGTNISIDYNHIDKYAILRQDVKVVGNGGCSTITFEGNGFNDLYAVDLTDGNGNTINHIYIGHNSNATTSVVFDFDECAVGTYNAVFHFTEEDMTLPNAVKVEDAKPIELETNVKYYKEYLVGKSKTNARNVPYHFSVTNKGNSTAYHVPIRIVFKGAPGSIVKLESLDVKRASLENDFNFEGMSEAEIIIMKRRLKEIENDPVAFIIADTDENDNMDEEAYFVETFVNIPPCSSVNYSFMVKMTNQVNFAYDVPKEYPTVKKKQIEGNSFLNNYCSGLNEDLDCILGLASLASDVTNAVINKVAPATPVAALSAAVSCAYEFLNTTNSVINGIVCQGYNPYDNNNIGDLWWEFVKEMSTWSSIMHLTSQCVMKFIPGLAGSEFVADEGLKYFSKGMSIASTGFSCINRLLKKKPFTTTPIYSHDPNDIHGYTAESGSHAVKDGQKDVYYTIEFENDPEQATAAAQEIRVTDELDATKFDLSTFKPTRIKIGNKSAELSGDKNFVTTIDMRPEIYAIAQVEGTFDENTGIAQWHITSLDPMTMEPTEDPLAGVLPVNDNGNGIGELSFDICLKEGLAHGTEVANSASIVFDTNEAIETPAWTNVIDLGKPTSHVKDVQQKDGKTAIVSIEADDDLSGAWRYDVYVQYGSGAWFKGAENVPIDEDAEVAIYAGIEHKFYTIVTDYAGNVEQKEPLAESTLTPEAVKGDVNGDGDVDIADAVCIVNHVVGKATPSFVAAAADVNGDGDVDIADAVRIVNLVVGKIDALARRRQTSLPEPE